MVIHGQQGCLCVKPWLSFLDTDDRRTRWFRKLSDIQANQNSLGNTWHTSEGIWIYFWDFWDMLDRIIT